MTLMDKRKYTLRSVLEPDSSVSDTVGFVAQSAKASGRSWFWQKLCSVDEGRVYARLFGVANFPHVAMMDPFTGDIARSEEGWSADKPLTADSFVEAYINLIPTPEPPSDSSSPDSIATSGARVASGGS